MTTHATPAAATTAHATTFDQLGLSAPILRALKEKKYETPSPIQAQAIPHLLAKRDMLGSAQTGTGKTAAFALPILQLLSSHSPARVARCPRVLILTPTRELAVQIGDSFHDYGRYLHLKHVVIYGGVGQHPQVRGAQSADICIATPGRLLDLAQQGHIRFDQVEIFVLDEADRMLDMGFAPDITRIVTKLPPKRQSLLFSATMQPGILALASKVVKDPVRVAVTPGTPTADKVAQEVCYVEHGGKYPLLRQVLGDHQNELVLIFCRTKHGANKLAKNLDRDGYSTEAIHGNKSQGARQRALEGFRSGSVQVLVATDVAARGIDVKGIALVINYDIPHEPEAYVHRIGRTARAGLEGKALSFCEPSERRDLRNIQHLIRMQIPNYRPGQSAAAPVASTPALPRPVSLAPKTHPKTHPQPTAEQSEGPAHAPKTAHAPAARHEERRDERPAHTATRPAHTAEHSTPSTRPAHTERSHSPRPTHTDRPSHSARPAQSDRPSYNERPARSHSDRDDYSERPSHSSAARQAPRPAYTPRSDYSTNRPSHSPSQPARGQYAPRSEHQRPDYSDRAPRASASDYSGRPHHPGPAQHSGLRHRRNANRSRFGSQRGAWGR
jgi:ATP-dependent RNA helicase RhlE